MEEILVIGAGPEERTRMIELLGSENAEVKFIEGTLEEYLTLNKSVKITSVDTEVIPGYIIANVQKSIPLVYSPEPTIEELDPPVRYNKKGRPVQDYQPFYNKFARAGHRKK